MKVDSLLIGFILIIAGTLFLIILPFNIYTVAQSFSLTLAGHQFQLYYLSKRNRNLTEVLTKLIQKSENTHHHHE